MPTRFDPILLTVTAAGNDISQSVETAKIHLGFQRRFAEATLTFLETPAYWSAWDTLLIAAGINANDMSGSQTRFNGYCLDPSTTHWPYVPQLVGQGALAIADRTIVTADAYADTILAPSTPAKWWDIATSSGYVDGIDLTQGDVNGKTDSNMVTFILTTCGLASRIATPSDIGGLAPLLGSYAFDQFVWRVKQSALQAIEELEKVSGGTFVTYETLDGHIKRSQQTAFAPFSPVFTFDEGTHILEGATVTREVGNIKNRVIVTGYDDGSGPYTYMGTSGVTILPPGSIYQVESYPCSMLESDTNAQGVGMSCEAVSNLLLPLLAYPMLNVTLPTHWDYPFEPGQVVYVNAPHLLGVNQAMWVQEVEIMVTPTDFTQTLTLKGADYGSTGSAPNTAPVGQSLLGSMTLGSSLQVTP
jgi:hypothetical protein